MFTYAQILNGQVHWIMAHEADLTNLYAQYFNAHDVTFVDITTLVVQPEVGWSYDGTNFTSPVVPVLTTTQINAPVLAQLSALDSYIPRGLEDYWTAIAFDVTKLPKEQQQRLAQKAALRVQLVK